MGFGGLPFVDTPGSARSEVYPSITGAFVSDQIAASGSLLIKQIVDAGNEPTSSNWIIASRPICSWLLVSGSGIAATLEIEVSSDSTTFNFWKAFPISIGGVGTLNSVITGLYIPGWMARFKLVNSSTASVNNISGLIKLQGVS